METTPGKRMQLWREFKGITSTALSQATGINLTTISQAENPKGKVSNPSYDTLTKMLVAYPDLNPDWLLLGNGPMLRDGRELTAAPKPAAPATPVAAEPEPDFTNGPGTIDASYVLVLKEQIADLKEDKARLVEENKDLRTENKLLLKKSLTSLGAADFTNLPPLPPPNEVGFGAAAKRAARAEEFDAYVRIQQEQGGVAELV